MSLHERLPARRGVVVAAALAALLAPAFVRPLRAGRHETIAASMLADPQLTDVLAQARALVRSGLGAGGRYPEVWIRDLNTFIDLALDADTQPAIRGALLGFFHFQDGRDEGIPDGYVPIDAAAAGPPEWTSSTLPGLAAFKNTVETDQESSLVQAVARYVARTGDRAFLDEVVGGVSVRARLARALQYPLAHRFSDEYGLLWGATTIDWGDVQPETRAGVFFSQANSHPAIDIYDNAMYVLAVDAYASLAGRRDADAARFVEVAKRIRTQARARLWDAARHKFRPHLYLAGSPFPSDFDEDRIYYHGGTAVAIEAGLVTQKEILPVLGDMLRDQQQAGAASIGLTIYPAYPDGLFRHPIIKAYAYQNGGDWTWFGARMAQQLVVHGYAAEAYDVLRPMVQRVERDHGFFEWYTLANEPRGSNAYRGAAGQLGLAIEALLDWARAHG